jgi:hypothetical protein
MNPLELLFGKKPVQQVTVRDITNQRALPGRAIPPKGSFIPEPLKVGGIGGVVKNLNPALKTVEVGADVATRLATGQNPVNAIVGPIGGLAGGALAALHPAGRNPIAQMAAYAAGSTALPGAIDWLSKNATLSDRYAFSKEGRPLSVRVGSIPPSSAGGESYRDAELRLSAAAQGGGRGGGNMGNAVNPGLASTSDRPVGTEAVLNGRPVYWWGKDYGWQQKQPGGGGGFDTGTLAAVKDRAYQEEAISTAQQTASNPLFQKYQVAELTKQYNEAKDPNKKRDIGLQIWAQTNPALAAKLKEGQLGYAQAQAAPGMSNSGGNLIGGLPMPSMNFNFSTDVQTPGTMEQNFGAVIPGVGMTSKTPMYDREMTARLFATPEDLSNFAFGKALIPDPGLTKMTEDQRRTLAAQYNMGLK